MKVIPLRPLVWRCRCKIAGFMAGQLLGKFLRLDCGKRDLAPGRNGQEGHWHAQDRALRIIMNDAVFSGRHFKYIISSSIASAISGPSSILSLSSNHGPNE